jgi:hypothetical protein
MAWILLICSSPAFCSRPGRRAAARKRGSAPLGPLQTQVSTSICAAGTARWHHRTVHIVSWPEGGFVLFFATMHPSRAVGHCPGLRTYPCPPYSAAPGDMWGPDELGVCIWNGVAFADLNQPTLSLTKAVFLAALVSLPQTAHRLGPPARRAWQERRLSEE